MATDGARALLALKELAAKNALSSIEDSGESHFKIGDGVFSSETPVPFLSADGEPFSLRAIVLSFRFQGADYMRQMVKGGSRKRFLNAKDRQELDAFMKGEETARVDLQASKAQDAAARQQQVRRRALVHSRNVLSRPGHDFSIALRLVSQMKNREMSKQAAGKGGAAAAAAAAAAASAPRPEHRDKRRRVEPAQATQGGRALAAPIIMLPANRGALIQGLNARAFLEDGQFSTAKECEARGEKRPTDKIVVRRPIDGHELKFVLMDAPHRMKPHHWANVVGVVVDGPEWQFKHYPSGFQNPVELFNRTCGVNIRYADEAEKSTVRGWKVHRLQISRGTRHADMIVATEFWRKIEQHIKLRRRDFLPGQQRR